MTSLASFLPTGAPSSAALEPVAWTLLHFLWQGALIAVVTVVVLRFASGASSQVRYAMALTGLILMASAPLLTYGVLAERGAAAGFIDGSAPTLATTSDVEAAGIPAPPAPPMPDSVFASGVDAEVTALQRARLAVAPYAGWLVAMWFLGVLGLAGRHAGGLWRLRGIRRRARPVDGGREWVERLGDRLGVNLRVPLLESDDVDSPLVLGFLKPAVLVPPSAFFGLAPQQLEAILLHELAHIRRFDAWVNLFQVSFETLFFYHPAVWWLSAEVRELREHCCDDIAVAEVGEPLVYAQALAAIEEMRPRLAPEPTFAMGAGGGSLLRRIRRLVQPASARPRRGAGRNALTTLVAAVLAVGIAALGSFATGGVAVNAEPQSPSTAEEPARKISEEPGLLAGAVNVGFDDWPGSKHSSADWVAEEAAVLEAAATRAGYPDRDAVDFRQLARWGFEPEIFGALGDAGLAFAPADLEALARYGTDAADITALAEADDSLDAATVRDLLRYGVDGDDIAAWRRAGYADISVSKVLELARRGLDGEDAAAFAAIGYTDLSLEELAQLARHGLDAEDVAEFTSAGFENLSVEDLVMLSRHGIDGEDIMEWRRVGLGDLNLTKIVSLAGQGLDADDVQDWRRAGYSDLSLDEIARLARYGIGGDDVAEFKAAGLGDLSLQDIERLSRHGIDGEDIVEYRSAGLGEVGLAEIELLSRHGLDAEDVAELQGAGLGDLSIKQMVKLAQFGLDGDDVTELRRAGLGELDLDGVIGLARHGIDGDDVEELRAAGLDELTYSQIIDLARHGVDGDDIEELRDAGLRGLTPEQAIGLARRGIDEDQVRAARRAGKELSYEGLVAMARSGELHRLEDEEDFEDDEWEED